jgi:hypothetical protein
MSLRADYIKLYGDKCKATVQAARIATVFSLTCVAISTSPNFSFKFGDVADGITSGYVVVYGPWILFALAAWYYTEVANSLGFRDQLLAAIQRGELEDKELSHIEQTLLLPAHITMPRFGGTLLTAWRNRIAPHLTLFVSIFSFCWLMFEYFRFHRPNAVRPWDIIWGDPFAAGFPPEWGRSGGKHMPWVYPPYFTFIYLCILVALIYFYRQMLMNYGHTDNPLVAARYRDLTFRSVLIILVIAAVLIVVISLIAAWPDM